jgi:hypothetical protein
MSGHLDKACAILDDFEKEVAAIKAGWDQMAADNPNFEQLSPQYWQEKFYRMWIHGATDVWECNELERLVDGLSSLYG